MQSQHKQNLPNKYALQNPATQVQCTTFPSILLPKCLFLQMYCFMLGHVVKSSYNSLVFEDNIEHLPRKNCLPPLHSGKSVFWMTGVSPLL